MTQDKFLKLLRRYIFNNFGTQTAAAKHWKLTDAQMSLIVNGIKLPTESILNEMKFKVDTVTTFKRV